MPDTATIEIVRATPSDRPALSQALARAFHDDPVFRWVTPDAGDRRRRLPPAFEAFIDVYLPHHETYVAGDGDGAALWAPAGVAPVDDDTAEAFGERLAEALEGDEGDTERAFALDALLEAHHPDDPCFYLQFLGVVPEHQGQGLGSRMLTTVLQHCDASGTPAYLEATSAANRRLYERHGFETVSELTLPDGPSLWPMWRDPEATG